jgi:tetratricopeptide (TPR) repeat protein
VNGNDRNSRPLARRRGFLFIFFGSRGLVGNNGPAVQGVCPRCRQETMIQSKSIRTWFTLFFIPIFPMSQKRVFSECSNCHARFGASPQQVSQQIDAGRAQRMQQTIAMYNSMRASPANSVTLNTLLLAYLELREFDQAVSAANAFQDALNASEQCMTTLGRVLIEQGKYDEAIQWFDAAIARNPLLGEASYCKAVALMRKNPPDFAAATTAARAARSAGLTAADGLIQGIQDRARASQ